MSGFCSAHKHFEPGCPQCKATGSNDPFGPVILAEAEIDQIPKSAKDMILAKHGEIDRLRAENEELHRAVQHYEAFMLPEEMQYSEVLKRAESAEAKLKVAVEALKEIESGDNWFHTAYEPGGPYTAWQGNSEPDIIAEEALAKIGGDGYSQDKEKP